MPNKLKKITALILPLAYRETRIILQAKWSNLQNTQQNSTKFSAMLGKMKKLLNQQFFFFNFE